MEERCENEFCIHHKTLHPYPLEKWNNTECSFYEIDPYDEKDNPDGFRVSECPARKKFKRMGWS